MLFAADSLFSLRLAVGGRLHLYRLPMLYRHIITMFVGAATTTTDVLPSLVLLLIRRMLCRHGCYLLVVVDGCFAVVVLFWWMLGPRNVVTGSQSATW